MRLCVIPDVHNNIDVVNDIIERENELVDQFVFLGDYFDNYHENLQDVENTAHFINNTINNNWDNHKFNFLIGNHDLHYIVDHKAFNNKGFTQEKFDIINDIITVETWEKLQWATIIDKWLFSHAGIRYNGIFDISKLDNTLNNHINYVINNDASSSELLGRNNGFFEKQLTPLYARCEEFTYNQMCGHYLLGNWQHNEYADYETYFIDSFSRFYAYIDTESNYVEIRKTHHNPILSVSEVKWLQKTKQILV